MKRIIHILVIIFSVQVNVMFSQDNLGRLMLEVNILAARNSVGGLSYDRIEGSPHYSDGFVNGTVYLKDGNTASLPLRYDLFQDEIEFIRDHTTYWIIKKDVLYIQYGKEILIPEPSSKDPGKSTYFFAQEKGKYRLYIRKKVSFYPEEPAQGYAEPVLNRFELEPEVYYLKQENMPAIEIRNKKALSEILSENEPALNFIKKSKIKVTKAEDLVELVKFLNTQ
ncbi:hypothetical protein ACFLTU_07335 [Bacteroidota bacterium]